MGPFYTALGAIGIELVCPACGSPLERERASLDCGACRREYPIISGIPDLRLGSDRFLSIEEDRAKGAAVLEKTGTRGYGAALEAYWSLTPELDPALARQHLRRQLSEREAGAALLRDVERRTGKARGPALDLGCGLGGFVAACAAGKIPVVGMDAAFRWALIAKILLEESGLDAPILCANAEHPPFAPKTFDLAVANDLLEHVGAPGAAAAGAARTARMLYAASTNRYSLAPEPHVHLMGVGWLPRSRQNAYVRLRRGHPYDRVRPLSGSELRAAVRSAGLTPGPVFAAPVFDGLLGLGARMALRLLERMTWCAPRIGVVGR